ncbi:hypothetical protein Enr13x_63900 [Stieleria neptunia]|uniref:Uncharacterized protein n=1 Tax=Stieleria neptunia TaxID=2527979 RepID=A0A518I039_9BACT|nr:hypothetical protein [Stieleria neptunia]QDV46481.1 hypothetical protein Enr13x_63900 [Stieleria neptunia]
MNDPAQNPYASSSATPGGLFPQGRSAGTIDAAARTGTIISLALISGVVMITVILTYLVFANPPEDQPLMRFDGDAMLFLIIGYGVFVASAGAAIVLRGIMKNQAETRLKASADELPRPLEGGSPLPPSGRAFVGAVATYTLIGQALVEGPAIINAIFMFIDNNLAHLVPIVLAVLGIALQIPTSGKIKASMEDAKR